MNDAQPPDGVRIVPDIDEKQLNRLQLEDYRNHRRRVLAWLYLGGKNPDRQEGYSHTVTRNMEYRIRIHRGLWERQGRYTTNLFHDQADAAVRELARKDWKNSRRARHLKISEFSSSGTAMSATATSGNQKSPFIHH